MRARAPWPLCPGCRYRNQLCRTALDWLAKCAATTTAAAAATATATAAAAFAFAPQRIRDPSSGALLYRELSIITKWVSQCRRDGYRSGAGHGYVMCHAMPPFLPSPGLARRLQTGLLV